MILDTQTHRHTDTDTDTDTVTVTATDTEKKDIQKLDGSCMVQVTPRSR